MDNRSLELRGGAGICKLSPFLFCTPLQYVRVSVLLFPEEPDEISLSPNPNHAAAVSIPRCLPSHIWHLKQPR